MHDPTSGWPRYDFHMHTRHSHDSMMRPRKLVEVALARGLAGIAVTDHDTIAGGLEARREAPPGFLVIVGEEISTEAGDIVGLFLEEEIRTRDPLVALAQIREQGGLAFLPHPLHGHKRITADVLRAVDAYETLNSRAGWFDPSCAHLWEPLKGKTVLGCSDAHLYHEVGRASTSMPGPATTANVRECLLAGRTRPHGTVGHRGNFYFSQFIRLVKTRDTGMLVRAARRLIRRPAPVRRQTTPDPPHRPG